MCQAESGWQVVAELDELPPGGLGEAAVGRQVVLLLRRGQEVLAFQGLCPHQFARLAEGTVTGDWLQCPRHQARFNLTDGRCGPGWTLPPLKRYAVKLDKGKVLLPDPLLALD
jgi:3-phenylpropionate/trans-cinnamate dioxygenase ferredoxin subunit